MEAVVGLLVMLLGVSHGIETHCDGRQNETQCYGALGGTVVLQLMDNASEIFRYLWYKNKNLKIVDGRKDKIVSNEMKDRSVFTPSNGTFRINNLSRTDGAEYTLETFKPNGHVSEQRTLQLSIQAPVSSVLLDSECLSQGEMRVSCSSEGGDSPQYSWTLDGHTLTDAQLLSGNNETNNITLKQDVSGLLVCSVRNHVSNVSKGEKISTCGFIFINCTLPDGTNISQWVFSANNTTPTMIMITDTMASNVDNSLLVSVLRAVVALSLLGGIAIYFAWKKKKYKKAETSTRPRIKDHPENSFEMVEL
ncbi:hepatocyte cell adhesion molecule-like [Thunnus albacares]|uniref:hepatocyte cell adhesion molecule-like n=1 Tax=Thunnus albacares TaxID=8236 RepID=UPI001CF65854|nr:hepatocyte cell adhesion molecule-like [Thunnus albacares]